MRFKVFYSADGTAQGSEFRLFHAPPRIVDFPEEYAVVRTVETGLSVRFYQAGKEFEFCGAGALCLASLYADPAMSVLVTGKSMSFRLERDEQGAFVCLPLSKGEYAEKEKCYLFPIQKVIVECLAEVQAVNNYSGASGLLKDSVYTTRIVVFIDDKNLRIVFRYFTDFNDKGEDQATGSVFRYLGALPIQEETWYDVYQHSESGAVMRCCKQGDSLVYTGNVTLL